VQVRGLIARTAVRPFDHPLAVRWRDLACEHGTSRPGPAGIGTAARNRPPRGGLTGTGGGTLMAAQATPSRAGSIIVIPGSPSGSEPDDRRWGRLRSSGQAQRRPGVAGPGTVVSARRPAAAGRRASSRRPPDETGLLQTAPSGRLGPSCSVRPGPCGDCGTSTIYRNACARTAAADRPQFLAGHPCHTRTELCATGRSVSTDRRPILPMTASYESMLTHICA
jgi:hypothetical protein